MPLFSQNPVLKKTPLHMYNAHEKKNTAQKNPTKKNHKKQQQLSKSQKSEYELSSQHFTVTF